VSVAVKHRQLVRQVGVFIEHPPENSMAPLTFTSTMLDEGTTFIFGSWICIANSLGGFNSHQAVTLAFLSYLNYITNHSLKNLLNIFRRLSS
jgi:hypothetical protein